MCLNSNPFKPFVISPKYQEQWNKEKEKKKEIKKEQSDLNTNTNTLIMSESDNKLNVQNEYIQKEKKLLRNRQRLSVTAAIFESVAITVAILTVILYML